MTFGLLKGLTASGYTVEGLFTSAHGGRLHQEMRATGVVDAGVTVSRRLLAFRQTLQQRLNGRPSLVAAHFALYAWPILDILNTRPFVVHFHGPWAEESTAEHERIGKTTLKAAIERAVYWRADRCIVLSQAFGAILHKRYGVPRSRIRIVPGAVEADRFRVSLSRPDARKELGWPRSRPTVLTVRRLVSRVGIAELVEAMTSVVQAHPDVLLCVAGTGPREEALRQVVAREGLESHVRFLGFVPEQDLPLAYRAADLTIVPTQELEGFGLITLESLAAGTPVLVTPIGGLPEAVSGLSKGLVLNGKSPKAIAAGLSEALSGDLSLPSSEACEAYVRRNFSWKIITEQTLTVYREVMRTT